MKHFIQSTAIALVIGCNVQATQAENWPPDGKLLERICQSENQYDRGVCDGYITGIAASKLTYEDSSFARHCLEGKDISRNQLRAIVSSYIIRSRARSESIDAGYAVSRALAEAYPCK